MCTFHTPLSSREVIERFGRTQAHNVNCPLPPNPFLAHTINRECVRIYRKYCRQFSLIVLWFIKNRLKLECAPFNRD